MPRKTAKPVAKPDAGKTLLPMSRPVPVATLPRNRPHPVDIRPDREEMASIATFMRIEDLRDLRFKGEIAAEADDGWVITAKLTALAVQACVISLEPVEQKISETVTRHYLPEDLIGDEIDLDPDTDDDPDPVGDNLDPGHLALEVLALALDPYPRSPDAETVPTYAAPPGINPMSDDDVKPFAGLAALKAKLSGESG